MCQRSCSLGNRVKSLGIEDHRNVARTGVCRKAGVEVVFSKVRQVLENELTVVCLGKMA